MRALGGDPSLRRTWALPGFVVFLLCVMCSSTTAERQSLASRDRTCCLRRCLPARPLRYYGFRGSIAHPPQSLCTLRTRRRRRPRNTRYRAPATAYPDRSLTGRTTPAYLAHKQSILPRKERVDCFAPLAMTAEKSLAWRLELLIWDREKRRCQMSAYISRTLPSGSRKKTVRWPHGWPGAC